MMTEELQTYISNLRFKDEKGERYYFSIMGEKVSKDGGNMLNIPIISIKQKRKAATGADTFQEYFDKAIDGKYNAIVVEEYSNCSDNATPIETMRFELSKPKGRNKKNGNQMSNKPSTYRSNGVDGLDNLFKQMGIPSGLQGFMQATAQSISTQERYEDAKQLVSDLKGDNKIKDAEIQRLKDENEKLRYQIKEEKDKVRDTIHESEMKIAEVKQQVGLLGLAGQFAGAFFSKTGMGQKLAGFWADGEMPGNMGGDAPSGPHASDYANIERYCKSLNDTELEMFCWIVQYICMAPANLSTVNNVCKKLYQSQASKQSTHDNNTELQQNIDL